MEDIGWKWVNCHYISYTDICGGSGGDGVSIYGKVFEGIYIMLPALARCPYQAIWSANVSHITVFTMPNSM